MASWNDLLNELGNERSRQPVAEWIQKKQQETLKAIGQLRGNAYGGENRNVILYASAFLQKPDAPQNLISITNEDINGFMGVLYQMDCSAGLTIILHTPGGLGTATETIVEYLHSKFNTYEIIVSVFAFSAGTMICLAANKIIMGRPSQLGPIDAQMFANERMVSAQSIVDQFKEAQKKILQDSRNALIWHPLLFSIGPALLKEAQNALNYSQTIVTTWLQNKMFLNLPNRKMKAKSVAKFFRDASIHLSHGKRIDRNLAKSKGVLVEDLESNQQLQDLVLTAYHVATLAFEHTAAVKIIESNTDRRWIKPWNIKKV